MGVVLFVTGLIIERPFPAVLKSRLFTLPEDSTQRSALSVLKGIVLLLIPGIEVFFMTICEFGILQVAHVLTLSIAGIVKELLTIFVSMLLLGERLSGIRNWSGMIIILLDVAYYNYFRYQQDKKLLVKNYSALPNILHGAGDGARDSMKDGSEYASEQELVPPVASQDYEMDTI